MGSLSLDLYRRNRLNAGTKQYQWDSWATISGDCGSIGSTNYGKALVCLRAFVDYTSVSKLTSVYLTLYLQGNSSREVSIYLYTSDPTNGSAGSIPTGYVASATKAVTTTTTADFYDFEISGLNITSSYVYLLLSREGTSTYVINPQASGGFLQPITMSLSSSSVITGNNQVATFTNGSGRSVSVAVKYNNTTLWSGSTTNGSMTIPVQKSWFSSAGITTYREFSVSIQATESYSGTIYDSFYIVAGSDMNPTVGTPTVSIVQASGKPTTNFPNTYLANISKAKIAVSVSSGSNASIASVVLTYTGGSAINMTYNSSTGKYEATTPELVSASTTFTVTAKDGRRYNRSGTDVGGMSGSATSSAVTVVQYSPPSLNVDAGATFRCTQGGNQDSGGAYFRAKVTASYYSALSGNSLLAFYVKVQGKSTTYNLTSGTQTGALDGTLAARTSYTLEFVIEDKVSVAITKTFPLGSQVRDIVAIHNSTGTALGVGTTPETATGSSVEMPIGGKVLVGGYLWGSVTRLNDTATDGSQFGKDFRNGVDTGVLYDDGNTEAFFVMSSTSGWANYPVSSTPFKGLRKVIWINSSNIFVVILEAAPTAGRIWVNYYNGSTWSGWKNHAPA